MRDSRKDRDAITVRPRYEVEASAVTRRHRLRRDASNTRAKARELLEEAVREDLRQLFGFGEALQAVAAERAQLERGAADLAQGDGGRRRDEDLPAVARVADARRGVDRDADIAVLRQRRAPGVQADPHAHRRAPRRPGAARERSLRRDRGG